MPGRAPTRPRAHAYAKPLPTYCCALACAVSSACRDVRALRPHLPSGGGCLGRMAVCWESSELCHGFCERSAPRHAADALRCSTPHPLTACESNCCEAHACSPTSEYRRAQRGTIAKRRRSSSCTRARSYWHKKNCSRSRGAAASCTYTACRSSCLRRYFRRFLWLGQLAHDPVGEQGHYTTMSTRVE